MRYCVRHSSTLTYAAPVERARFNLRLKPRPRAGQQLVSESLTLLPEPQMREDQLGPYWVKATQIGFGSAIKKLKVKSEFVMDVTAREAPSYGPALANLRAEALDARDLSELAPAPYMYASRIAVLDTEIARWGAAHLHPAHNAMEAGMNLMRALYEQFTYAPGKTNSATPPQEAFAKRHGVCQDFAHVMIIALRAAGVPAAYVSGYLLTLPPPGKPKLIGADAMHAWVDIWCGRELGWVGFDPTNNCLVSDSHIPIAMGRDYADVSPISGTFIGSAPQTMTSAVDVRPIE